MSEIVRVITLTYWKSEHTLVARKDSSACVVVCSPVCHLECLWQVWSAQPGMGRRKPCAGTAGRVEVVDSTIPYKRGMIGLASPPWLL
ncbi:hypothetical protein E2C01_085239 [Portunus trituberculatus]|uniref:Uncharacterized protein n=1 Tax=Portunus trituberculatus TaxID=210409 RepID=A0A5B7J725_PORTR|nr:hypothetical protein [Portunus trituberculatus]